MVITKEWLKECSCPNSGGYTTAQFEVLKMAGLKGLTFAHGTAQSGWREIIIGQEIDEALAFRFYEFRTKYTKKVLNRHAKEEGEGNLSLF